MLIGDNSTSNNTFLIIFFGIYKALSILGFIYLVCNNHPCWGLLLLLMGASESLKIEDKK